jgi:hypothetical protein
VTSACRTAYGVGPVPLQNRVSPLGELVAEPGRGLVYGNRGCLHDAEGRIRRMYAVRRWIACRLEFRGRHRRPLLQPRGFTELFFLDEATAFAAGHRPCALCRHDDYRRFCSFFRERGADAIDARLHDERLDGRGRRLHEADFDELPDGAYVLVANVPRLVRGDRLLLWTSGGYTDPIERPTGDATLLTPPSLVAALRAGWTGAVPLLHPSAWTANPACPRAACGFAARSLSAFPEGAAAGRADRDSG